MSENLLFYRVSHAYIDYMYSLDSRVQRNAIVDTFPDPT